MSVKPPETFHLDRCKTPIGVALLVTDTGGALRALDWEDYEPRMRQLLRRYVLWRVGLRWYLLVLVGVPLFQLVCSSVFLGTAPLTAFIFTMDLPNIVIIVVAGQIWEEGGGSGFAVPTLPQRFGAKRGEILYAV